MESSQDAGMDKVDQQGAEEVMESLGEPEEAGADIPQGHESEGSQTTNDPLYVQKRLKQQKRAHDREMRELQARMSELQSQVGNPKDTTSYSAGYEPQGSGANVDETIQRAVSFALQQKELEERKAKEAQAQAEIAKEYSELGRHLDQASDKYDDFDEVVRASHVPFTPTIRDAALVLPKEGAGSAAEVLYKLGKNPEELARISQLPPHKQVTEVIKLSHAMARGGDSKPQNGGSTKPLNTIKSNPVVNSVGVTEKTPPSQIRALMKAGKFK